MKRRPLRGALLGTAAVVATASVLIAAASLVALRTVAARPGEWSVPLPIGVPDRGMRIDASVASLSRVATSPIGLVLLDGRSVATRVGLLRFARVDAAHLAIDCAPCLLRAPALGDDALVLRALRVTVARAGDRIAGTLVAGDDGGRVTGRYAARFGDRGVRLAIDVDRAPVAAYYRAVAASVPEARVATIGGTAAFTIRLELPSATLSIEPAIEGLSVSGLGTERLAGRPQVACDAPATRRASGFGDWLPRAVIAAEDQRYYEHPGYDLDEVAASLVRNQSDARIARGASTIPQQLAKLLFTGSERTASRKLRELLYAAEMERTLGKARMLQLYLSIAPWGDGRCGADAAARHWFGRPAARLSGAQAVWLAAMLHAPDREAERWASSGGIDLPRASRIAAGLAGVGPAARKRIVAELSSMAPTGDGPPIVAAAGRRSPTGRSACRRPPAAGS